MFRAFQKIQNYTTCLLLFVSPASSDDLDGGTGHILQIIHRFGRQNDDLRGFVDGKGFAHGLPAHSDAGHQGRHQNVQPKRRAAVTAQHNGGNGSGGSAGDNAADIADDIVAEGRDLIRLYPDGHEEVIKENLIP